MKKTWTKERINMQRKNYGGGNLNGEQEVNNFCLGVIVGINLYQQKVIAAQKHNKALRINGELYYVQDAKERLQDMIDKFCR